jgi:uncharacterized protein YbbC (DUF1343 family)
MLGIDSFIRDYKHLQNVPIGLLTNHSTLAGSGYLVAVELLRNGFSVKKLFSPEHGILSQGVDGIEQPNTIDPLTKLPVVSLYGHSFQPQEKDLKDIEIVMIDLPNIGCRFYTYLWSITYMIEVCANAKKKVIFLDRPNLSERKSSSVEGPMLDEKNCSSFIGRWDMPLTFSHSFGELIQWFVKDRKISIDIEVVPFDMKNEIDTAIFVPPSPSMVDKQTVLLYPFSGLFEGLNLNHGRGTAFPFKVLGAPWIDSLKLLEDFKKQKFPGIIAFPFSYKPTWSLYSNLDCNGLFFSVEDADAFRPVQTGIWLMNYLSVNYPNNLKPEKYPTMANPDGKNHLDLLLGTKNSYQLFCSSSEILHFLISEMLDVSEWTVKVQNCIKNINK